MPSRAFTSWIFETRFFIALHGGGIGIVARGDHHHGKIFVDQRVRSVLHFACGIAFGVNVGNFLQLESAFERDGEVNAAAEIEKIGVAEELARNVRHISVSSPAESFPSCAGCALNSSISLMAASAGACREPGRDKAREWRGP